MRLPSIWTLTIAALVAACGSTTEAESAFDGGAVAERAQEKVAACPGADGVRSGACSDEPACTFIASCTPGTAMVCNTRWDCACESGRWSCVIAEGSGFGCTYCPGYGPEDAPATDAGSAADADAG